MESRNERLSPFELGFGLGLLVFGLELRVRGRGLFAGSDHFAQPLFHLVGSLVGERHAQNSIPRHPSFDQFCDSERDDSCLASPGTRQDQQRPGKGVYRVMLSGIESTHRRLAS